MVNPKSLGTPSCLVPVSARRRRWWGDLCGLFEDIIITCKTPFSKSFLGLLDSFDLTSSMFSAIVVEDAVKT
jgi:hypothetical protein